MWFYTIDIYNESQREQQSPKCYERRIVYFYFPRHVSAALPIASGREAAFHHLLVLTYGGGKQTIVKCGKPRGRLAITSGDLLKV